MLRHRHRDHLRRCAPHRCLVAIRPHAHEHAIAKCSVAGFLSISIIWIENECKYALYVLVYDICTHTDILACVHAPTHTLIALPQHTHTRASAYTHAHTPQIRSLVAMYWLWTFIFAQLKWPNFKTLAIAGPWSTIKGGGVHARQHGLCAGFACVAPSPSGLPEVFPEGAWREWSKLTMAVVLAAIALPAWRLYILPRAPPHSSRNQGVPKATP